MGQSRATKLMEVENGQFKEQVSLISCIWTKAISQSGKIEQYMKFRRRDGRGKGNLHCLKGTGATQG